ncbi:MAG: GIY-YIG nuclease family protein [Bacteroidales bacterium]|nr:GIY-YIG nuclease family protein [Bacteroidales bacterium]
MTKKYLYIIRIINTNYYKIGIANNPERRLNDLQIAIPFELTIIYKKQFSDFYLIETYIHNTFINKHIRGEWFELAAYDINSIQNFLDNLEHTENIKKEVISRLRATKKYQKKTKSIYSNLKSAIHFKDINLYPKSLDIKSRWHISYYAKNNKFDTYKRFRVYGGLNKIKSKSERLMAAEYLKLQIIRALEAGFNPFDKVADITKFSP